MIDYVLFDIDNTLYPATCGLGREMDRRMTVFVADYLQLDLDAANEARIRARQRYGTTLTWLQTEHGMRDVDPYMAAVHPADLAPWILAQHAADAQEALSSIDRPAAVLTNGPREHALRVLERLGLSDRFERIFDLRSNGYVGKPAQSAYLRVLDELRLDAGTTLFVDDVVQYLLPFRDLGGQIVLMAPPNADAPGIPRISHLRELALIIHPEV